MIARINGEDITANLSSVNDTYMTMSVMLERIAEDTVSVSFMSSISLEMSLRQGTLTSLLKIPPEFIRTVTGLLGNFDGDDTNDLMYRNGTIASDDIPDREKHILGQTCELDYTRKGSISTNRLPLTLRGHLTLYSSECVPSFTKHSKCL